MTGEVVCVGELLWDSLPAGLFLGGAPFNVAGHLRALGLRSALIGRVGRDRLGEESLRRVTRLGVAADMIQIDATLPTGFVAVDLDAAGTPTYEIVSPAAWDAIELTEEMIARASAARAIVHGSLARRSDGSRAAIDRLCEVDVLKVFDVNLRPPFLDPEIVRRALSASDLVKLNEDELGRLRGWYDLPPGAEPAARALAEEFGCEAVCVTRGAAGAALLRAGRWSEHPGFEVEVVDTVGSGDAFLAALLVGYLAGEDDSALLERANRLGAYVASRPGAIPPQPPRHPPNAARSFLPTALS